MEIQTTIKPQKIEYVSGVDGTADWYMFHNAGNGTDCLVNLHGHGSAGDQFFVSRQDELSKAVFKAKFELIEKYHLSIIAPNLRGNAWMCPSAVSDLADILCSCRNRYGFRRYIFLSGSMGGTGSLIFAVRRPELVDALGIAGGVTKLRRYLEFLKNGNLPIHKEILEAIESHYDEESYDLHDVSDQAEKLTMPLFFAHGEADLLMPVSEMHDLHDRIGERPDAIFRVIPGGDHNAPCALYCEILEYLLKTSNPATGCQCSEKDRSSRN